MERKAAYSTLAEWFEYLNDDCDYENWSQYLIKKLAQFGNLTIGVDNGLDVGCGGGYFTRALQRYGYEMTGMDVSSEMLDRAQSTAFREGVRSEYILGDISKGRFQKKYSFAISINDCFNYVEKGALKTALKNVYACLKKGGVFVFDVSSPKKYREKFNDAVNVDDRDDVTYLSFAKTDGECAFLDVTLFTKNADGSYTRHDETHTQYIHTEEEIDEALRAVGFTLLQVEGHLGEEKSASDRLVFIVRK